MERTSTTSGRKKTTPAALCFTLFLLHVLFVNNALAFECSSSLGKIPAGGSTTPGNVEVTLTTDMDGKLNSIFDLSDISCRAGKGYINTFDYLDTMLMTSIFNSNIFQGQKSGLIFNGKKYYTPIADGIRVASFELGPIGGKKNN